MKKIIILVLGVYLCFSCEKDKEGSKTSNSDKEKIFYTIGQMYARRIDYLHLSKDESDQIIKGVKDWLKDKKSSVDFEKTRLLVQDFIQERMSEGAKGEKEKGKKYFDDFVKSGGKVTSSGIAYQIIKPGSKVKPTANDTVEVHYEGTLVDGSKFDSSVERGEKASFPLNAVIKGWQEGLQLIGEGGEIKFIVPSDLAYGDNGSPPKIPGGASLIFRVTLYKVMKSPK